MLEEANMDAIIQRVEDNRHEINVFRRSVTDFFETHPELTCPPPIIHSIKSRTKHSKNLREKIQRKSSPRAPITQENIFSRITDIAGVRILHLYQAQFSQIHSVTTKKIDDGDWILHEQPRAYTWDPESQSFFADLGLVVEVKDTLYTSIHYVVKPREDSLLCCEIQVRTLFEEIWGEIDHLINYPEPTDKVACRNQIGVLARLVGAGSRLADSICHPHSD